MLGNGFNNGLQAASKKGTKGMKGVKGKSGNDPSELKKYKDMYLITDHQHT